MYAGETVEITSNATQFDGVAVTPTTLNPSGSVVIEIIDPSQATPVVLVDNVGMVWDVARSLWSYLWESPSTPGNFTAKVTVTGAAGTEAFEYLKLKLTKGAF